MIQIGYEFQIVTEVEKEFLKKPTEIGFGRLFENKMNDIISVIDFDQKEIDISSLKKLEGLDLGESVSILYLLQNKTYELVSDDYAVHNNLKSKFGMKCKWTAGLLQELISMKIITLEDAQEIYLEMKQNGFWGFKKQKFTE
ncbi:MAG: hypothetical protein Q7J16_12345 [Candidatus Cloacimonadales bacterium]|nr:hypothetical protein [Candidatus Cloacimonadales bacterium]